MASIDFLLVAQGVFGIFMILAFCWAISENRRAVDIKAVLLSVGGQIFLALLATRVGYFRAFFLWISEGVYALKAAALVGTSFVFGYLGGGDLPFALKEGANAFVFAFQPLPMIMVVSALAMLLFHWKILPLFVRIFSSGLQKTLNVGGALGVCAAAKIFLGQTEAPLLIRPYLAKLSRSELFSVMVMGMATTSSAIMIVYATILEHTIQNPISHILTASIINIPAALAISRLMVPNEGKHTDGAMELPYKFSGAMEAVSQGASDGLKLFLNIIAMLVVMLALVSLANAVLSVLPSVYGEPITLQRILGLMLAPIAWLMGVSWDQAHTVGNLIGVKTTLNEIMAFISLADLPQDALSPRVSLMMTYALCGFANFSSIGIQIGGLGTMVPERRPEIIEMAFKAMIAGTLASCMSGAVIGLLWWL